MNDAPGGALLAGAVTLIEAAPGHLFLMGWFRLRDGVEPSAWEGAAELLLGPPGTPLLRRPLRRTVARAEEPRLRRFEILVGEAGDWPLVEVELRLGEQTLALTSGPVSPAPFVRRGALEQFGRNGIAGWVFDLPREVPELLVDGRFILPIPLDRPRPDLPFDDVEPGRCLGFQLTPEALGTLLRAHDPALAIMDGVARDVSLLLGGQERHHLVLRQERRLDGRLERAGPGLAEGWATEAQPGPGPVTVDVALEGTRWRTVRADLTRQDLVAHGVGSRLRGGAMRIPLPWRNPTGVAAPRLSLRAAHGLQEFKGTLELAGLSPWRPDRGGLLDALPLTGPAVTIIIPIYNAAEDLDRCVASVLRHTTGVARLLLIDDASPDPAVSQVLARHAGRAGVEIRRNPDNRGFTATCNIGLAAAGRDDVVLLNSDTIVGPGWLDGLRLAAGSGARVGTVTPLSNNAGAFSVPEIGMENSFAPWFLPEDMARLARQSALALWPEVPTGHGFCLYIRRACLDAVGQLDEAAFPRGYGEENDFCLRAQRAGFSNLLDDRTLVWHRRSASFGGARPALMAAGRAVLEERYPEYSRLTPFFAESPVIEAVRWRVRHALAAAWRAHALPRPRVLFVISTQSGGTPQTNRDLMDALSDRYEPWLLRCESGLLELRGADGALVEQRRLDLPVAPATHHSDDYDRAVADMLIRHGIELVHVRHIAWHGIGLPALCRRLGIPVVFSFHDFYTACPTVKLLDAEDRFCAGRCTEGEGDCTAELWPAGQIPPLRHRFIHRWRAMMAGALAECDAFVTTAPSARAILLDAFPMLRERDLRVIPHGRDFTRMQRLAEEPALDEPLRVLVPGNISRAKGSALIAEMAALDLGQEVEFHVLGEVDQHLRAPRPGVVLHGPYRREEFAERVRAIRPHLAAVFSIWAETWCHTLTESWSAGLPVLAFDVGSQAERIREAGAGWVLPLDISAEEVLASLAALRRDRDGLRAAEGKVVEWQRTLGRHSGTASMAAAYDLLYQDVLRTRRSFAGEAERGALPCPVVLEITSRRGGQLPPRRRGAVSGLVTLPVTAGFPFARLRHDGVGGLGFAGQPGAVLVRAGALALRDLPDLLRECDAAGMPVMVELDETEAAALALPGAEAVLAGLADPARRVLARRPVTVLALSNLGIRARLVPPPGLSNFLPGPRRQERRPAPPWRVLLLRADGAAETSLGSLLLELEALGLVELVTGAEEVLFMSSLPGARLGEAEFAALPGPVADPGEDPLLRAATVAGLPVLVPGELWPAAESLLPGLVPVPTDPDEAARCVTKLLTDASLGGRLCRASRQRALRLQVPEDAGASWEALVAQIVRQRMLGA